MEKLPWSPGEILCRVMCEELLRQFSGITRSSVAVVYEETLSRLSYEKAFYFLLPSVILQMYLRNACFCNIEKHAGLI